MIFAQLPNLSSQRPGELIRDAKPIRGWCPDSRTAPRRAVVLMQPRVSQLHIQMLANRSLQRRAVRKPNARWWPPAPRGRARTVILRIYPRYRRAQQLRDLLPQQRYSRCRTAPRQSARRRRAISVGVTECQTGQPALPVQACARRRRPGLRTRPDTDTRKALRTSVRVLRTAKHRNRKLRGPA